MTADPVVPAEAGASDPDVGAATEDEEATRLAKFEWWLDDSSGTFLDFANRFVRLAWRLVLLALGITAVFSWAFRHDLMFLLESLPAGAFYIFAALIGIPKTAAAVTTVLRKPEMPRFPFRYWSSDD